MKITKKDIKQFIIDALMAFIFYTLTLSPYMIFIVKTTLNQYMAWLLMQAILVPPLGAIFAIIARKIKLKN